MFTEEGMAIWKQAEKIGLGNWYEECVGNFGFTENDLFENMNKILMWLETHEDYVLIYQYCIDYEGRYWWLTPKDML